MQLLWWIAVGLFAGFLTGRAMRGSNYGSSMDIAMGVVGAVVGAITMRTLGFAGYLGTSLTALVATSAAVLLTLLMGLANGRRVSARQLWNR